MAECGKSMSAWSCGRWSQRVVSISTPAAVVIENNMKKYSCTRRKKGYRCDAIALIVLELTPSQTAETGPWPRNI
jgi:hypothetical protein